jgi:hypothetical protein
LEVELKYTIEGFSQEKMVALGMDAIDAVVLRWIVDFTHTGKMKMKTEGDRTFYWIQYGTLIKELPILKIEKQALAGRLKKMVTSGILTHKHVLEGGSYSYFGFGDKYETLISGQPLYTQIETPLYQDIDPLYTGISNKDSSSIDSSTTDIVQPPLPEQLGLVKASSLRADPKPVKMTPAMRKLEKRDNIARKITDYYQKLFVEEYGAKPAWDGKIIKLVKADIARLGDSMLGSLIQIFFENPTSFVTKQETGMGYNIFHSQIDALLEKRRRAG